LPEGSVSYLEYALFLSGAVMIFVVSPITTAIFPVMGEHKAKNNEKALLDTFHETVKVLAFLAIPSALFLGLEAKDIVAFLLGTGRFSPENAAACAGILAVVATMIVPQSINFAMGNLFLVHGKTKAISFANIALTLTAIPVYIVAAEKFGVLGIAATYAGHYTIAPLISIAILRVGHPGLISRSFIPPTLKFLAATAFSAMVTLKIQSLTENLPVWTRLCATGIGLAAVYWVATEILVIDTLAFIVARLKNEN
jgi:peptidoglycan biosynthesis protein MviN/MurJ (putative lipid II flippase)